MGFLVCQCFVAALFDLFIVKVVLTPLVKKTTIILTMIGRVTSWDWRLWFLSLSLSSHIYPLDMMLEKLCYSPRLCAPEGLVFHDESSPLPSSDLTWTSLPSFPSRDPWVTLDSLKCKQAYPGWLTTVIGSVDFLRCTTKPWAWPRHAMTRTYPLVVTPLMQCDGRDGKVVTDLSVAS